jgi:hypothetical protein
MTDPDRLHLIHRFWDAQATWHSRLKGARLDVQAYFEDFNARISMADHIAYREERKSLSGLSELDVAYIELGKSLHRVKRSALPAR